MGQKSYLFDAPDVASGGLAQLVESDFANLLNGLHGGNGVLVTNDFLTPNNYFESPESVSARLAVYFDGMGGNYTVHVRPGVAMIAGYRFELDAEKSVALANPSPTTGQDRLDYVVLELDTGLNRIDTKVVQGATGTNPTPPSLTQLAGQIIQLPLALIRVRGGSSFLSDSDIKDERVPLISNGFRPAVRMTRSSTYPITSGAFTAVKFTDTDFCTVDSMIDQSVANLTKFVAPITGFYLVSGYVSFSTSTGTNNDSRMIRCPKFLDDGTFLSVYGFYHEIQNLISFPPFLSSTGVIHLEKDEFVMFDTYQKSGVTLNGSNAMFSMVYLGGY